MSGQIKHRCGHISEPGERTWHNERTLCPRCHAKRRARERMASGLTRKRAMENLAWRLLGYEPLDES